MKGTRAVTGCHRPYGQNPFRAGGGQPRDSRRTGPAPDPRHRPPAVAAEGIQAADVDRIVAEAQVVKATFYRHFPAKDDMVCAYWPN
jgi:Bacterial regulatory proteins, tetR family